MPLNQLQPRTASFPKPTSTSWWAGWPAPGAATGRPPTRPGRDLRPPRPPPKTAGMERRWPRAEPGRRPVAIARLMVLALATVPAGRLRAAEPEALRLEQVVSAILAHNTDLKLAALEVDSARGALMAAA